MRINNTYLIFILSLIISCHNSPDVFAPITEEGETSYNIDDFMFIAEGLVEHHSLHRRMNHSQTEIGVFPSKSGIEFKNPMSNNPYYFNLEDGKLEVKNYGEFGGEFNFIPTDTAKDTLRILNTNIIYTFRFNKEIYFLVGIAHGRDQGGGIAKLTRKGQKFEYELILELDSAPQAMTIYKDKILIAGHSNFTVVRAFKKEFTIDNTFWSSLYPNSMATLNGQDVYVGMRGGYAIVSLSEQLIKYYVHKEV